MKNFVIVAGVLVAMAVVVANADWSAERKAELETRKRECSDELGIDEDILKKYMRHEERVDEKQVGCMLACLFKKDGAMVEGKLLLDKLPGFFSKMQDVTEECINKTSEIEDECEKSLQFAKCHHESVGKM